MRSFNPRARRGARAAGCGSTSVAPRPRFNPRARRGARAAVLDLLGGRYWDRFNPRARRGARAARRTAPNRLPPRVSILARAEARALPFTDQAAARSSRVSILARAEARALRCGGSLEFRPRRFQSSRAPRRARCGLVLDPALDQPGFQSSRAPRRARCGSRASPRYGERISSCLANLRIDALPRPRRVRRGGKIHLVNQVLARLREPVPYTPIASASRTR